jgi:hypothetical protein
MQFKNYLYEFIAHKYLIQIRIISIKINSFN